MEILRNLEIFVEVARARSFRRAAEALGIPSSTVSRRISELERDVGLRLFNRSTRNVSLTDAGERYFAKCEHIMEEAQNAHAELTDLRTKPSGLIRVSTPAGFAQIWLVPLLPRFASQYPEIELELNCTQRVPSLITDPVDVAVRSGPVEQPDAVARLICRQESGLYASPGYLRRRGAPRKPKDLLTHECLAFSSEATVYPWVLTHADGRRTETIVPGGKLRINYMPAIHDLAVLGMGIAPWNARLAAPEVCAGKLVRVLPDWSAQALEIYAVTATRRVPAKVRAFIDFLVEQLAPPMPAR